MSETWFISDLHFGHANILEYEAAARPFESLEEMHETLIENWNKVVGPFDKVFVLGDFAFGRDNIDIAYKLIGQKRLILGNHDKYPMHEYLEHFLSVHGCLFWNEYVLTHIPVHPDELLSRSKYNIHGHKHSKLINDPRYINVSCEQNNLTPINADEIIERMKSYEKQR